MPVCKPPAEMNHALRAAQLLSPAVGEIGASAALLQHKALMTGAGYALFFATFGLSLFELSHAAWEIAYLSKNKQLRNKRGLFEPVMKVVSSSLCVGTGLAAIVAAVAAQTALTATFFWAMPLMLGIKAMALLISVIKNWVDYARSNKMTPEAKSKLWRILLPKTILCACLISVTAGIALLKTHPLVLLISAAVALCIGVTGFLLSSCAPRKDPWRVSTTKQERVDKSLAPAPPPASTLGLQAV